MSTASKHPFPLSRRSLLGAGAGGLALALLGCGGDDIVAGIGSGGTGSFSSGSIRGFGSILVGSIHYDESAAEVLDDAGQAMDPAGLRLGMVVDVNGEPVTARANGRREARARTIAVRSEIEGPITDVDPANGTFTVLEQAVRVTPATVFGEALRGGLQALQAGQVVAVFGFPQGGGQYVATRVEAVTGQATRYKLRGVASDVDTVARTLRIGPALVSWADAGTPAQTLADGQYLRIELAPDAGPDADGGAWRALDVKIARPTTAVRPDDDAEAEVEGYISSVSPADSRFVVLGVTVDYGRARFEDGSAADLAPGVKVEVEGRLAADGMTLIASDVEFDDDDDDAFEIEGRIDSVSPAGHWFEVRGVRVGYDGRTRFEDGTESDLAPGVRVEVEGRLAADGTTLIASEIEFDD